MLPLALDDRISGDPLEKEEFFMFHRVMTLVDMRTPEDKEIRGAIQFFAEPTTPEEIEAIERIDAEAAEEKEWHYPTIYVLGKDHTEVDVKSVRMILYAMQNFIDRFPKEDIRGIKESELYKNLQNIDIKMRSPSELAELKRRFKDSWGAETPYAKLTKDPEAFMAVKGNRAFMDRKKHYKTPKHQQKMMHRTRGR